VAAALPGIALKRRSLIPASCVKFIPRRHTPHAVDRRNSPRLDTPMSSGAVVTTDWMWPLITLCSGRVAFVRSLTGVVANAAMLSKMAISLRGNLGFDDVAVLLDGYQAWANR
jgi:hypothetical protein